MVVRFYREGWKKNGFLAADNTGILGAEVHGNGH